MKCETCNQEHEGSYGSGRFCDSKCARAFSTKSKRQEINEKVSAKLTGKPLSDDHPWKSGQRATNDPEVRKRANATRKKNADERTLIVSFEELKDVRRIRKRVLHEQGGKCKICGIDSLWNGKELKLHLDHIDGVHSNNERSNLRMICPNCHSQTETYAGRNKASTRV